MKIGERCQVRMSFEDDHDFETLFVTPLGGQLVSNGGEFPSRAHAL
jgi:hypothetical protein